MVDKVPEAILQVGGEEDLCGVLEISGINLEFEVDFSGSLSSPPLQGLGKENGSRYWHSLSISVHQEKADIVSTP